MNSPNRAPQHTIRPFKTRATLASVTVLHQSRVGTAANAHTATAVDLFQNPLWIMAIVREPFALLRRLYSRSIDEFRLRIPNAADSFMSYRWDYLRGGLVHARRTDPPM